ncbi:hypothetical protein tpqmel_0259 [Candidatus Gastranaerophilus sp. (ex Termes propinquus)]|nr:hypothetical protein tpqmel_0259 [Candidatus Gastranaerophilus sp. (ex Termes propinquus)]
MSRKINNIIEALSKHQDIDSIRVLDELGTNSEFDEVREQTSRALIRKNTHDALKVVIVNKGKGINDLSASVAMTTINELLALKDKCEALKVLEDTINLHSEKEVQDTARSVKALMTF